MAVRWKIPFQGLKGDDYEVDIYDSGWSGAVTVLTGGAEPFVVSEDDTDDMFTPVRKQSGYINIVDTGSVAWETIFPTTATSRPVVVKSEDKVVWQGFLQPQTFAGQLYGDPQTRRLPVQCCLSVLYGFDISPTWAETADFGQVLGYILSFIPSLTVGHICIAGGLVDSWLKKRIDWANLRDEGDDGIGRAKYSAGELLEEVCKFWGWTARVCGVDFYFTAGDSFLDPAFMVYDMQDLTSGIRQPSRASWQMLTLSGDVWASDNNDDLIMLGVHRTEVTADINKYDSVLEMDVDKYNDWMDRHRGAIYHWQGGSSQDRHYFYRTSGLSTAEETEQGEGVIRWDMGNCWLEIDVDMGSQPWHAQGNLYQFYYYEGQLANLHDIPFRTLLKVNHDDVGGHYLAGARIRSKHSVNFDHGVIVIEADTLVAGIVNGIYYEYNGRCDLTCRLKVGNYYWDGSNWTTSDSTFTIPNCGGTAWSSGSGKIESNRQLDPSTFTSPYPNYYGFGVPVTRSVSGELVFEILDLVSYSGSFFGGATPWCGFTSLGVKFLRALSYAPYQERSTATYTGTTRAFTEDKTVSVIFASDNGFAAGLGIIMNEDNSYCAVVAIDESGGSYYDHPEQYLADRMSNYGATIRKKLVVDVWDEAVTGLTPEYKVVVDGVTYYPVAIERAPREDKTRLTLLEVDA